MPKKEIQDKLDIYEEQYFQLDEPVPFVGGLKIYPIKMKDYNRFHNSLGCLTMDKSSKYERQGELGQLVKVANLEGISQNYLCYLTSQMSDPESGTLIASQLIEILSLVFHIDKGMYCPHCGRERSYVELLQGREQRVTEILEESISSIRQKVLEEQNIEEFEIPSEIIDVLKKTSEAKFIEERIKCDACGEKMEDSFKINKDGNSSTIDVRGVILNNDDFDLFKSIVPHQNIIDYQGDKEINGDLKEELEIKSKLRNKDYVTPSLEKQLVCVMAETGMSLAYLKELPLRKFEYLLSTIDRKIQYQAQLQGQMSGMVEFKEPIKHWIYSDDKYDINNELTLASEFEKKFQGIL